ncbi:MAG: hypothetical protein WKF59_00650 [Chitinophagaceae bacterium]
MIKIMRCIAPGDPYPYEGKTNPYVNLLKQREYFIGYNNKETRKRNTSA